MTTLFLGSGDVAWLILPPTKFRNTGGKASWNGNGNELGVGHVFGVPVDKTWKEAVIILRV